MSYTKRYTVNGWKLSWEHLQEQVGRDSEYADICNPQGCVYQNVWWCTASKDGQIYSHFHKFYSKHELIQFWQKIWEQAEGTNWSPENNPHWKTDPVEEFTGYGSKYHQNNYHEFEMGLMDDEEQCRRYR